MDGLSIPRLSNNIEVSVFDADNYLVKHTQLEYRLKINHSTMQMLSLVDGHRSIEEIAQALSDKLQKKLDVATIYNKLYLGDLANCGIVETTRKIEPKKADGYIWLKFIILKAKNIEWLAGILADLFRPSIFYFLFSAMLICLLAVLSFFVEAQTIFDRFTKAENLFLFYVFLFVSVFLHEMGHASACKRFGAKHGDLGFGFYLIFPVFYADVSDSWRLSRKQRIIIDLAGIYMELILYTAISLVYFLTRDAFLIQLVFIRLLGTVTNLNPFLRFDGYWALSDSINIPNLKANSDKKLKATLQWLFGNASFPLKNILDCFMTVYASVSWAFVFVFIGGTLLFNFHSIIYFPKNISQFLYSTLGDLEKLDGNTLKTFVYNFTVPFMFYFMLFSWLSKIALSFKRKLLIQRKTQQNFE
jgi:putative peptide zinc metalloprotease protein